MPKRWFLLKFFSNNTKSLDYQGTLATKENSKPVPKFLGQVLIYPKLLFTAKLNAFSKTFKALSNLTTQAFKSPPFSKLLIVKWSFSLTNMIKLLLLLTNTPLPVV